MKYRIAHRIRRLILFGIILLLVLPSSVQAAENSVNISLQNATREGTIGGNFSQEIEITNSPTVYRFQLAGVQKIKIQFTTQLEGVTMLLYKEGLESPLTRISCNKTFEEMMEKGTYRLEIHSEQTGTGKLEIQLTAPQISNCSFNALQGETGIVGIETQF